MLNVKFTVEKKQLNVLFFQLFVDNHFKCSYYVRIVIFLNSKRVLGKPTIKYSKWRIK